jgi:endoglucanase
MSAGRLLVERTALTALTALLLLICPHTNPSAALRQAAPEAYVRVNQVGYLTQEPKQALLMASGPEDGAVFSVIEQATGQRVYSAPVGPSQGGWNSLFSATYRLDFTLLRNPGVYLIEVSGPISARSPVFRVDHGSHLYAPLLSNALFFYQAQHDGANVNPAVMDRRPSHLKDRQAFVYATPIYQDDVLQGGLQRVAGPVDASGGWFDAGDYIKLVETASYTDVMMLLAVRQYPALLSGDMTRADFNAEGRYGLDWLQKMWDASSATLYYQVGIGDGNGDTILGDHDFWRLPQADDRLNAKPGDANYYVEYRPVFRAGPPGTSLSPNLAGRLAAALALCYQLYYRSDPPYASRCLSSAEMIFDLAKTEHVGQLLTAAPYDYYPEVEWRDDMELGATELYFATALGVLPPDLKHRDPLYYLRAAASWAQAYISGPNDGADSLNLYDVSGLAHYELYRALTQAGKPAGLAVTGEALLADLKRQLDAGIRRASHDPFGLGVEYGAVDATPHALGYALEAAFYDELTADGTYRTFAQQELNWVLGENAWGSSFIVGAGSLFPHCMQHQVANLAGSLDGTPPIVLGATVDGPSASANFQGLGTLPGMRPCPPAGGDPFRQFSGKGVRYVDNVVAWPSVEPADDYAALTVLLFARLAS